MRRNFAQILKSGSIDIKCEYEKIFDLFYYKDIYYGNTWNKIINEKFIYIPFRGICLTLEEFNLKYNFNFVKYPQNFNIDYLISFIEYTYNLINRMPDKYCMNVNAKIFFIYHINSLIEKLGYISIKEDKLSIFVPKDATAISVSEMKYIPQNMSYKLIEYNHYSKKGDIQGKKEIILLLSNLLEPYEGKLKEINPSFKSDLFFALNNFNIRHNNIDASDPANFRKVIAEMSDSKLESWYDEIYQMCLYAFMSLEQNERKDKIKVIKNKINN